MSTKAKKASDISFEDNGLRYCVETAGTGRSSCKRCKEKIDKGALRFGSSMQGAMHGSWFWHHLQCASSTQVSNCMRTYNDDIASVPFYDNLSEDDKTTVREHFSS